MAFVKQKLVHAYVRTVAYRLHATGERFQTRSVQLPDEVAADVKLTCASTYRLAAGDLRKNLLQKESRGSVTLGLKWYVASEACMADLALPSRVLHLYMYLESAERTWFCSLPSCGLSLAIFMRLSSLLLE